ncbi:hypothetical protein R1sor_008288 [Riccia sorocarpa]|uniref:Uncharacterized protein n=1 Tax=Riccia sorocarpa TaxID=122646 RepID=A0ABD3HSY1_9MARC
MICPVTHRSAEWNREREHRLPARKEELGSTGVDPQPSRGKTPVPPAVPTSNPFSVLGEEEDDATEDQETDDQADPSPDNPTVPVSVPVQHMNLVTSTVVPQPQQSTDAESHGTGPMMMDIAKEKHKRELEEVHKNKQGAGQAPSTSENSNRTTGGPVASRSATTILTQKQSAGTQQQGIGSSQGRASTTKL